jgi:AGCS family alanine or glycine:cation symporter
MIGVYVAASLYIIGSNYDLIPMAFTKIFTEAFAPLAVSGGMVGVIVVGFQRAMFSSEAGLGSAPIAHASAKVKYPVRQGIVALYEPFIDTVIVCTMTALVIVITGVYDPVNGFGALIEAKNGSALTAEAFRTSLSWFPSILTFSIFMFAFSTLISWSYYGEIAWAYLFGSKTILLYKGIFLSFIILATIADTATMVDFSSILFLAMAVPNIFGLFIMSGDVKDMLREYLKKLKSGELDHERI